MRGSTRAIEDFATYLNGENSVNGSAQALNEQGPVQPYEDELTLKMTDEELLSLAKTWRDAWSREQGRFIQLGREGVDYWLGKQLPIESIDRQLVDNLIFESLETLLPQLTKQNPTPVVEADNTPEGDELALSVQRTLMKKADELRMKLQVKKAVRNVCLKHLGVIKIGWSAKDNDIEMNNINPSKLILDPDSTIDTPWYTGEFIGEKKATRASVLIEKFPKHKELITQMVQGKMGTTIEYFEWWTNEYVFWELKDTILLKSRNPHWNYEGEETVVDPETGASIERPVDAANHFRYPRLPYLFLSIYNLGEKPYDDTTIVRQVLSLQDIVNRRLEQININADRANAGIFVSGQYFTDDQATQVADQLRRGNVILVPNQEGEPIGNAVMHIPAPSLPPFIYQHLVDVRNEIKNIFGVRGSTAAGILNERTVQGKIEIKGSDSDRSTGLTDYIEQFADGIFNYMTQMFAVYYSDEHVAIYTEGRKKEEVSLSKAAMTKKLLVSVKEGSLIPKDPLTKRNEAIDLYNAGVMDPITLFERLDFPDPEESARKVVMYKQDPMALFGEQSPLPQEPPVEQSPPELMPTL